MAPATIFTLPKIGSAFESGPSLREEIETGLLGQSTPTVPGNTEEDKKWAYTRSVPTVVLYDEQGLRLYDKITSEAPEYYLFNDELNLLKQHGDEIARCMGFPGAKALESKDGEQEESLDTEREHKKERRRFERELEVEHAPQKPWRPAKWGDAALGKWNNGVNGEQGLGGGFERGYDVVELGAGALRKTGHLLTALANAAPTLPDDSAPITYHPLDLSHPELHRVLGEMDEAFGSKLGDKVECIGLHGDYSAGLQFIKEGKLPSLRSSALGGGLGLDGVPHRIDQSESARSDVTPSTPPSMTSEPSPPFSPTDTHLATPELDIPLLPAKVAGEDGSYSVGASSYQDQDGGIHLHMPCARDASPSSHRSAGTSTNDCSTDRSSERPLHLVFLGSSLGNFSRESAGPFLGSLPLRPGDTLLIGLDGRPHPGHEGSEKVRVAYNDPAGHTRAFEEHGWEIVRQELGLKGDAGVEFVGRYNQVLGRHEAYFRSRDKQTLALPGCGKEVTLEKDELLNIEWSYKYSTGEALELFNIANLCVINSWKAPDSEYRLWLVERPAVSFTNTMTTSHAIERETFDPTEKENRPNGGEAGTEGEVDVRTVQLDEPVTGKLKGVPSWKAWQEMWALWDHITLDMIPPQMLHTKPIDLRHICLFYLGHIPTFLDIHLTRLTNGKHTEPEFFKEIFERGIDPDVDDPTKIHSHSEVPVDECDWPTLDQILAFRNRVRQRLYSIYVALNNGSMACKRKAGRVLFMTYEHEGMHAETLLYMLIQSPSTIPPSAAAKPQWDVLARSWANADTNKVLSIPGGQISMGHDDLEAQDDLYPSEDGWAEHEFGWDNEHPAVVASVKPFKVDALPISNSDYLAFAQSHLDLTVKDAAPALWVWNTTSQEWNVRTLYGPVGFDVAGKWPLQASKCEIDAYAKAKGGRLPTEPELRLLWESEEGPRPAGEMANVGYKKWHPLPPTRTKTDHAGRVLYGHNGGVWEWTSSEFKGHEGYVASEIYPGYSADFFDGKHFLVLGGSYATVPCMAGRKSFRNWYQGNYRFSFIGGRVVYDA